MRHGMMSTDDADTQARTFDAEELRRDVTVNGDDPIWRVRIKVCVRLINPEGDDVIATHKMMADPQVDVDALGLVGFDEGWVHDVINYLWAGEGPQTAFWTLESQWEPATVETPHTDVAALEDECVRTALEDPQGQLAEILEVNPSLRERLGDVDGQTPSRKTLKLPAASFDKHNERRRELGLSWSKYIDGQAPEIESTIEQTVRRVLEEERRATQKVGRDSDYY